MSGSNVHYYHYDGSGSTIAMTDSSGTMVNKYVYDEFGSLINAEESVPNPFLFVGQYGVMDDDNGLIYMRARYYDPEVGRFINKDPIGYLGGDPNLFCYVANDPVNLIDPSGLQTPKPDYISVTVNYAIVNPLTKTLVGITGVVTLDRYGNLYLAPGVNVGKSLKRYSSSIAAGRLQGECQEPNEAQMRRFLKGHSINIGYGYWIGQGLQYSPATDQAAIEWGVMTPQLGVSYHHSWRILNLGTGW